MNLNKLDDEILTYISRLPPGHGAYLKLTYSDLKLCSRFIETRNEPKCRSYIGFNAMDILSIKKIKDWANAHNINCTDNPVEQKVTFIYKNNKIN